MQRPSPRLHRFPHRVDYTLIPAPLDLSLPLKTEKDSLPAIIVTPSSPSSARDFSIAFLEGPPKPTVRERITSYAPFISPFQAKARTFFVLAFILFIIVCHLVTHIASVRPHLQFSVQTGDAQLVGSPFGTWIRSIWGEDSVPAMPREFLVNDLPSH
ncbi:hypothetical protein FB45DRAFT_1023251 [Roridomyces roridus]|uniref:Uncharacterized protein n=1 Tax=Roridomyces roridus TaxID=1738132 RepID=A0AAD7FQZ1_9AGAR|nr:hypothetical protein FB45DRAFT_1023251 [Roridomyces roridus]